MTTASGCSLRYLCAALGSRWSTAPSISKRGRICLMNAPASVFPFDAAIDAAASRLAPKVIAWRRDFHQNPQLGNRALRPPQIVAEHLRALGFAVVHEQVA